MTTFITVLPVGNRNVFCYACPGLEERAGMLEKKEHEQSLKEGKIQSIKLCSTRPKNIGSLVDIG